MIEPFSQSRGLEVCNVFPLPLHKQRSQKRFRVRVRICSVTQNRYFLFELINVPIRDGVLLGEDEGDGNVLTSLPPSALTSPDKGDCMGKGHDELSILSSLRDVLAGQKEKNAVGAH